MKTGFIIFVLIMLNGCAVSCHEIQRMCIMLAEKPGWYAVSDADSWEVSEGLILSLSGSTVFCGGCRHVRRFVGLTRPSCELGLWVSTGERRTWSDYRRERAPICLSVIIMGCWPICAWYVDRAIGSLNSNRTRTAITWHITRVLVAFSAVPLSPSVG